MKKNFIILLLISVCIASAQSEEVTAPDYSSIEKKVSNNKSSLYFKTLFERYNNADTTMTIIEKRHLYYGYSFQEDYAPYSSTKDEKMLFEILKQDNLDNASLDSVIMYTGAMLKKYPFSLRTKQYRVFAFSELNDNKQVKKEMQQAKIIIDAILSTGDGSEQLPFYVIKPSDEYDIIRLLGFEFGGEQLLTDESLDYLTLKENPYQLEGFYFEISRSLESITSKY